MHMADALVSPAVGGVMYAASAAALGFSVRAMTARKSPRTAADGLSGFDEKQIPMMGVMGAFVFAAQMINFTIPGTGSSGHIGGGVLLAAVLGPFPALITLAAVLLIQCLFFADGGLLALGCNIFNMGACASLFAWALVYRPIARRGLDKKHITLASILACAGGLQLGAFLVVLETFFSGVTALSFGTFVLLMQPIHLAIGLVEGLVTAAVLCFVHSARPELLESALGLPAGAAGTAPAGAGTPRSLSQGRVLAIFGILTVLTAAGLSLFASAFPDGLEWSLEKTAGSAELEREGPAFDTARDLVEATAFMPGYGFKNDDEGSAAGTAAAGIAGSVITVALAAGIGLAISLVRRRRGTAGSAHDGAGGA